MKNTSALCLFIFLSLLFPVRAEETLLPEEDFFSPTITGNEPPEDLVLRSNDSPEQKKELLKFMANGFERKENYIEMIRILRKTYEIHGLDNSQKAATAGRISLLASNYSSSKKASKEKLRKASAEAAMEAFQFSLKSYEEAPGSDKFDRGLLLLGYASAANQPASIARGVKCAEELLSLKSLSIPEKNRVLNAAIELCGKAGGGYEKYSILFLNQKLELFSRTDTDRARIRLEIAQKQFYSLRDLAAARETMLAALKGKISDSGLLHSLQTFSDFLADSD